MAARIARNLSSAMALALVACASTTTSSSVAPPVVMEIPKLAASPPSTKAAAPVCAIDDVRIPIDLLVTPSGAPPFGLHVRKDVPVRVTVETGGENRWPVDVGGAIEVHATLDDPKAVLSFARDLVLGDDFVRVPAKHWLAPSTRAGNVLTGDAKLGELRIGEVRASCELLAIARATLGTPDVTAPSSPTGNRRPKVFYPKADRTKVCRSAGGSDCVLVDHDFALVPAKPDAQHVGPSIEVRTTFDDGTMLHGWVALADVEEQDLRAFVGVGTGGGCGCSNHRTSKRSNDPRAHFGEARIAPSATIFATPAGQGAWATVKESVALRIEIDADDEYAKITDLPGLSDQTRCDCSGFNDHAYVARAALSW